MLPATVIADVDVLQTLSSVDGCLRRVQATFESALRSDLPPVQRLVDHLETYRGKMLRPSLVILCGLAARDPDETGTAEDLSPAHTTIAAVCEMIHMATLVHDDVLDEADVRRKGATVNRLRGNEAAVILGDYLFSCAYRLCSTLDSQSAALLIGETGMTLCAGELLQLHHRENLSIDEPTYFEIVKRKTGSLIATACKLGALQSRVARRSASAGSESPVDCDRFYHMGMKLGIAFQIQDDLLDLTGNQAVVGKPLRRDIELGKLTLPVIHHLATARPERRAATLQLLEDFTPAAARTLTSALDSTGSIAHARSVAERLVDEAKALLAPIPESAAKRTLLVMADQVVARAA